MRTCAEARVALQDRCDGGLDVTVARALEDHLGACASCREAERRIEAAMARLEAWLAEPVPPRRRTLGRGRLPWQAIFLPAAAAVLLWWMPLTQGPREAEPALRSGVHPVAETLAWLDDSADERGWTLEDGGQIPAEDGSPRP